MQFGLMEVVGAASVRRGLSGPLDLDLPSRETPQLFNEATGPDTFRTMPVGSGIVVHAGSQVYVASEGAWFTLMQDALAKVLPGEGPLQYMIGGEFTDTDGSTRVLKVTKGQWAVEWLQPANMTNPSYPDYIIRAVGQADAVGAATAFHEQALVGGTEPPKPEGMSTATKVAIGVGIAGAAVLVLWLLTRK